LAGNAGVEWSHWRTIVFPLSGAGVDTTAFARSVR
jgi:hypothetical protein